MNATEIDAEGGAVAASRDLLRVGYVRHPARWNCKRRSAAAMGGWRRLASVSGDGLAQGLFGFGGGFFGCSGNELVTVFSRAGKNLGERHQIGVFVESDFCGVNCGVGLDGHGRDFYGSAAAGAGEFERGFGGAGNFFNDVVAFWKVVSPTTNGRDILNTICVVICALAENAPMISASSVESANFGREWLHEISLRFECAREDISQAA